MKAGSFIFKAKSLGRKENKLAKETEISVAEELGGKCGRGILWRPKEAKPDFGPDLRAQD